MFPRLPVLAWKAVVKFSLEPSIMVSCMDFSMALDTKRDTFIQLACYIIKSSTTCDIRYCVFLFRWIDMMKCYIVSSGAYEAFALRFYRFVKFVC